MLRYDLEYLFYLRACDYEKDNAMEAFIRAEKSLILNPESVSPSNIIEFSGMAGMFFSQEPPDEMLCRRLRLLILLISSQLNTAGEDSWPRKSLLSWGAGHVRAASETKSIACQLLAPAIVSTIKMPLPSRDIAAVPIGPRATWSPEFWLVKKGASKRVPFQIMMENSRLQISGVR